MFTLRLFTFRFSFDELQAVFIPLGLLLKMHLNRTLFAFAKQLIAHICSALDMIEDVKNSKTQVWLIDKISIWATTD